MKRDVECPNPGHVHIIFTKVPHNHFWPVAISVHAQKEKRELAL
jgi:hypothetical protein